LTPQTTTQNMIHKNKFLSLLSLAVFGGFLFFSCQNCIEGEGSLTKQIRIPGNFNAMEINIPGKVVIKQGDTTRISIESYANVISAITTKVRRNVLYIEMSPCLKQVKSLKVEIMVRSLKKIVINGSAQATVLAPLKPKRLNLTINGSGTIQTDVNTPRLDAEIRGSGEMIINGKTLYFKGHLSGSGVIRALGLISTKANLNVTGSGEIFITTTNKLNADISGSGIIHYSGSPRLHSNIKGNGKVSKVY